jgi:hypothetical protein
MCVCHTQAPMQHEEKLNNGVFALPYTLHSAALDSRQCIALVMSNPILRHAGEQHPKWPGRKLKTEKPPRIRHMYCCSPQNPLPRYPVMWDTLSLLPVVRRISPESELASRYYYLQTGNFGEDSSLRPAAAHSLFIRSGPAHTHPKECKRPHTTVSLTPHDTA